MKTIKEINLKNKKVIVRVDYNVPIKDNKILDDKRIVESLKTINYLIKNNCKIILMSHLGKVCSKKDMKTNSLLIVSKRLSELLKKEVYFCNSLRGEELQMMINGMVNKDVLLLENTRFLDYKDNLESNCDEELSWYWSSLADVYIMDAFGSVHRKHASTYGIPSHLPHAAGFLVIKEIKELDKVINKRKNLLLGGSKVSDKITIIQNLIDKTKYCLIGGIMCATFLKAEGYNVGKTFVDEEKKEYVKKLLKKYKEKIVLPIDVVTENGIKDIGSINSNETIFDIGPKTIKLFITKLNKRTLTLCNGTMGMYEDKKYENGTKKIFEYLSGGNVFICGGDTSSAIKKYKTLVSYISTGGGSSLEYLSGESLPGLKILR